jgi:hypothetical protein
MKQLAAYERMGCPVLAVPAARLLVAPPRPALEQEEAAATPSVASC